LIGSGENSTSLRKKETNKNRKRKEENEKRTHLND
jgi:hypothetical protein